MKTIEGSMRIFGGIKGLVKLATIFVFIFSQSVQAQDWNVQSQDEQQRIREMRLLEWHAQEQAQLNAQAQEVSINEPHQQASAAVAPDRESFFEAASAGNINAMSRILAQGLNINVANSEGETALHMAAARGHFEAVRFLVGKGAAVNAVTVKRWIPLHHAVRFRHPNIVNFLIQRGASVYARTSDGLTAVDMARNNNDYRLLSIMGAR